MLNQIFDPSFWFTLRPAEVGGVSGTLIFGFFLLLFILGVVSRIAAAQKLEDRYARMLGGRIGTMLVTFGIFGVLLYFFSYERIRLLGSRFWYLIWILGLIVWVVFIVRFAKKTIPELKQKEGIRAQMRKYFPPRRKR